MMCEGMKNVKYSESVYLYEDYICTIEIAWRPANGCQCREQLQINLIRMFQYTRSKEPQTFTMKEEPPQAVKEIWCLKTSINATIWSN
jgi:hypothetical protein